MRWKIHFRSWNIANFILYTLIILSSVSISSVNPFFFRWFASLLNNQHPQSRILNNGEPFKVMSLLTRRSTHGGPNTFSTPFPQPQANGGEGDRENFPASPVERPQNMPFLSYLIRQLTRNNDFQNNQSFQIMPSSSSTFVRHSVTPVPVPSKIPTSTLPTATSTTTEIVMGMNETKYIYPRPLNEFIPDESKNITRFSEADLDKSEQINVAAVGEKTNSKTKQIDLSDLSLLPQVDSEEKEINGKNLKQAIDSDSTFSYTTTTATAIIVPKILLGTTTLQPPPTTFTSQIEISNENKTIMNKDKDNNSDSLSKVTSMPPSPIITFGEYDEYETEQDSKLRNSPTKVISPVTAKETFTTPVSMKDIQRSVIVLVESNFADLPPIFVEKSEVNNLQVHYSTTSNAEVTLDKNNSSGSAFTTATATTTTVNATTNANKLHLELEPPSESVDSISNVELQTSSMTPLLSVKRFFDSGPSIASLTKMSLLLQKGTSNNTDSKDEDELGDLPPFPVVSSEEVEETEAAQTLESKNASGVKPDSLLPSPVSSPGFAPTTSTVPITPVTITVEAPTPSSAPSTFYEAPAVKKNDSVIIAGDLVSGVPKNTTLNRNLVPTPPRFESTPTFSDSRPSVKNQIARNKNNSGQTQTRQQQQEARRSNTNAQQLLHDSNSNDFITTPVLQRQRPARPRPIIQPADDENDQEGIPINVPNGYNGIQQLLQSLIQMIGKTRANSNRKGSSSHRDEENGMEATGATYFNINIGSININSGQNPRVINNRYSGSEILNPKEEYESSYMSIPHSGNIHDRTFRIKTSNSRPSPSRSNSEGQFSTIDGISQSSHDNLYRTRPKLSFPSSEDADSDLPPVLPEEENFDADEDFGSNNSNSPAMGTENNNRADPKVQELFSSTQVPSLGGPPLPIEPIFDQGNDEV